MFGKRKLCKEELQGRSEKDNKKRELHPNSQSNVTTTNNVKGAKKSTATTLCEDAALEKPSRPRLEPHTIEEDYFRCYADIGIHEQMLNDKVRTLAYRQALLENKSRLKEATVLDVGAGTGILSHFAAQAGASKVFAVEPTRIARFAEDICKKNESGRPITVIQSKIEDTSIEVKVDAIVSEWMGYSLLYESMLPSVLWARDRYLKPGGDMYPCKASLFLAPITDEDIQERSMNWKKMKDLYGVSMDCLEPLSKEALTVCADSQHLSPECVVASACHLCSFDLMTMTVEDSQRVRAEFNFRCYGHNVVHGFATWFSVMFPGGVTIDTSPYALATHWGQTVMYLTEPLAIKQDSVIKGVYQMHPKVDNQRFWDIDIEFELDSDGKVIQHWHCAD